MFKFIYSQAVGVGLAGSFCLMATAQATEPVESSATAAVASPPSLVQPDTIPGEWEWSPRELPPLEEIIARPLPEHAVYGLYSWESDYRKHRDFIRETGWKSVRLSGPINDEIMKAFAEDGMEVMFTMPARKPFAAEGAVMGPWRNRSTFATDEEFIAEYLKDVTAVLERYGKGGTFWAENPEVPANPLQLLEVFNEPNFWYLDTAKEDRANHFPPKDPAARAAQDSSRQKLYAKLLVAAYAHIKSRWPEVQVVGFAAGGAVGADVPFIKAVHELDPAVAQSYDILSTHPYVRPAPPEGSYVKPFGKIAIIDGTRKIREIMASAGTANKPLWWTELNWTIFPEQGGSYDEAQARGVRLDRDITPELQAAYTVRSYALALRLGVERLHFMSLVDTDNVNAGMLARDGSTRPVASAVKTMIELMPFPRLLGAVQENEDGVYIYRFAADARSSDNKEVVMAYRVQGPKTVSIPWAEAQAEVIDMVGGRRTVQAVNGSIELEIGPLPQYITAI